MIKRLLVGLFTIIIMLVLLGLVAPLLIPAEQYKQTLLQLAEEKLNRKIIIKGDVKFSLLPELSLQAADIVVHNPNTEKFVAPYFVKIGQLTLALEPIPLLEKKIIVKELTIDKADMYFEQNASGVQNWQIMTSDKGAKESAITDGTMLNSDDAQLSAAQFDDGRVYGNNDIKQHISYDIGAIRVKDAAINYSSGKQVIKADDIDISALPEELAFSANVIWNNMRSQVKIAADNPYLLWEGGKLPLKLELDSDILQLALDGALEGVDLARNKFQPKYSGYILAYSDSIRDLQAQFTADEKQIAGDIYQIPLRIESQLFTVDMRHIDVTSINANAGDVEILGDVSVLLSGNGKHGKPLIKANLSLSEININNYKRADNTDKNINSAIITEYPENRKTTADTPTEAGNVAAHDANNTAWSKEKVDLSALRNLNADLSLQVEQVIVDNITLEKLQLLLRLRDGRLTARMPSALLAGGNVTANIVINVLSDAFVKWQQEIAFNNVPFEAVTAGLIEDLRLHGATEGEIFVSGRGSSIFDWINSLSGNGSVKITNGIIEGYSLAELFHNLPSAKAETKTDDDSTDFTEIALQLIADNGVIRLQKGELRSPHLKAQASGSIDLGGKKVSLRLKPVIVPNPTTNTSQQQAAGLLFPLKIYGKFNDIKILPDLSTAVHEALTNEQSVKDAATVIREEGRALRRELKQQKQQLKDSWQQLKDKKDAKSLNNLFNNLENIGLPVDIPGFTN